MESLRPSNRVVTESELIFFPKKTSQELGLTEFSKASYTYKNPNPNRQPTVDLIIDSVAKDVANGEKYYFLRPTSPFIARERDNGQFDWVSVDAVNARQVEAIGNSILATGDQSFYLNTGSHGDPDGNSIQNKPAFGGGRVSAGNFILEDLQSFLKSKSVGLYIVAPGGEFRRPANVNHVMIAWCFSYTTAKKVDQIAKDIGQYGSLPDEFRCSLTGRVMTEPVYFDNCSHVFEKSVIENYIYHLNGKTCYAKTGWFSSCGQNISPDNMEIDLSKKRKIQLFLQEREDHRLARQQVTTLEKTNRTKDARIADLEKDNTELKASNQQKDGQIIDLQGKVTVLDAEKQAEKQAKELAIAEKATIYDQKQELTKELKLIREDIKTLKLDGGIKIIAKKDAEKLLLKKEQDIRDRISLMQLGDIGSKEFIENAEARLDITENRLKDLQDFSGLLVHGYIYQKTPFVEKGVPQGEEILKEHIKELFQTDHNTVIQLSGCCIMPHVDHRHDLYKDILKITSESFLNRFLRQTYLFFTELKNISKTAHVDLHQILTKKGLRLNIPMTTFQGKHTIEWSWKEDTMQEVAVIAPKTYAEKLTEIISRLIAIRWCKENNKMLGKFLAENRY